MRVPHFCATAKLFGASLHALSCTTDWSTPYQILRAQTEVAFWVRTHRAGIWDRRTGPDAADHQRHFTGGRVRAAALFKQVAPELVTRSHPPIESEFLQLFNNAVSLQKSKFLYSIISNLIA